MLFEITDIEALEKFVGLPTKLLLRGDGGVTVRVWHAHLTEAGARGLDTLVAMAPLRAPVGVAPLQVEITYANEAEAPFAHAHATTLNNRGLLAASACEV